MPSSDIGWHFPADPADQWAGFNDPGIEHFRGNPYGNLAREAIQNSLDAGRGGLVDVSFHFHEVPRSDIPNVSEFSQVLKDCLSASDDEGKKAKEFFEKAIACLARPVIKVLSVADENTVGMSGPPKNGSPYYAYMKATGQSKKDSETAAGSYGIGKYAPLAVSELRTLFVSTAAKQNSSGPKQYTQGKSILMSHYQNGGSTRQGTGYWGLKKNCMPIEGLQSVPAWLLRSTDEAEYENRLGTTLHVIGFDVVPHWEEMLMASVLENFFGAVASGSLAVSVQGNRIAKDTIGGLFSNAAIRSAIEGMKGEPDKFEYSKLYHDALVKTEDVIIENHENRELGNCEVRIMLGELMPKKVVFLRNGMFITDQLDHLKRFSGFKEFIAVVQCKSTKGNELLRAMEPPKHDDFEPERLVTRSEQQRGKRALSELAKWVREMLNRHARDPVSEVTQISELADYFGDDLDSKKGAGEEVDPEGKIALRAQPLPRRATKLTEEVPEEGGDDDGENGGGGSGGDGGGGGGGGTGPGDGGEGGTGGGGGKRAVAFPLSDLRSVPISKNTRRVSFTPSISGGLRLALFESGADADRRLVVVKSTVGVVQAGGVSFLIAVAGMRMTLDVELKDDFEGSMKVIGYEV